MIVAQPQPLAIRTKLKRPLMSVKVQAGFLRSLLAGVFLILLVTAMIVFIPDFLGRG